MSFILEALKKSEQERRRRQVPDLQSEHSPPPERGGRRRLWPVLILVALLLNAALLSWWLRPWSAPEPLALERQVPDEVHVASTATPASTEPPTPGPSSEVEKTTSAQPEPPPPSRVTPPAEPPPTVAAKPAIVEPVPSVPRMEELPLSLRRELPDIVISLHFYTDSPAARMVRINGRNLREKQRINDYLTLQEITEEGVVLDFNGQSFFIRHL